MNVPCGIPGEGFDKQAPRLRQIWYNKRPPISGRTFRLGRSGAPLRKGEAPVRVGIDFGTSNSSAAVYDGQQSRLLPLDPAARDSTVMRSLLYLARDGSRVAGQEALNRFNNSNVGHVVKLKREQVA